MHTRPGQRYPLGAVRARPRTADPERSKLLRLRQHAQHDAPAGALLNAAPDAIPSTLSSFAANDRWVCVLDTFDEQRVGQAFAGGTPYRLAEHSLAVFLLSDEKDGPPS
jgi:hypothetical protein